MCIKLKPLPPSFNPPKIIEACLPRTHWENQPLYERTRDKRAFEHRAGSAFLRQQMTDEHFCVPSEKYTCLRHKINTGNHQLHRVAVHFSSRDLQKLLHEQKSGLPGMWPLQPLHLQAHTRAAVSHNGVPFVIIECTS